MIAPPKYHFCVHQSTACGLYIFNVRPARMRGCTPWFSVPSSCSCYLHSNTNVMRMIACLRLVAKRPRPSQSVSSLPRGLISSECRCCVTIAGSSLQALYIVPAYIASIFSTVSPLLHRPYHSLPPPSTISPLLLPQLLLCSPTVRPAARDEVDRRVRTRTPKQIKLRPFWSKCRHLPVMLQQPRCPCFSLRCTSRLNQDGTARPPARREEEELNRANQHTSDGSSKFKGDDGRALLEKGMQGIMMLQRWQSASILQRQRSTAPASMSLTKNIVA